MAPGPCPPAEVRAERDELAVAERVLERVSEQLANERASVAPTPGQVGGRAVMLIPHHTPDMEETMLPPDYQHILAAVRQAAGPVMAHQVGEILGVGVMRSAAQVPAGEPGALAPERRRALEEIDPWWCPTWPIVWRRAYAVARAWWLECDGRVDWAQLPAETVFEGEQLGRWIVAQRAGWPGLEQDRQDLLTALGIEPDPELVAAKAAAEAKPKTSRADRFAQGLAALARFVEREGHVRVPRPHREELEVVVAGPGGEENVQLVAVGLGAFLNNTKAGRAKLTAGQLGQLAEHGVEWA
ncbi:helicase associated domain-containing protein [Streptomyces sp. NRRL B-24484]|uniref:helicase associated domain-containing protein n=1 Tax=Streptomyces sp. NRRL B-24484 TaxID=1463833 RepID=UPI001F443832|nr:helicase associated domain-containing protein [Streptomyces sp. NRRL B-24484]